MNKLPDTVLIEALDLMDQGLGVDDILARFPQQEADLRPFLMTAAALPRLAAQSSPAAELASKQAFLAEAGRLATGAARPRPTRRGLWRLLASTLAVLVMLIAGGAGLARASVAAVPGDALYQTKLFIEETQLNLTGDPERAAELRHRFSQERRNEVERLLAAGREAEVSLTGEITAMDGARWTVGGVPVVVSEATEVDGTPSIGAQVQVDGHTAGDAVVARGVTLLVGPVRPLPTPPSPPTGPQTVPVQSPSAPSVTPSATSTPAPTATSTLAATPSPAATATPDDDDDDDDDLDDDDTDSDDDDGSGINGGDVVDPADDDPDDPDDVPDRLDSGDSSELTEPDDGLD